MSELETVIKVDKLTNEIIVLLNEIDNITNLTAFKVDGFKLYRLSKMMHDAKHIIDSIMSNL